MKILRLALVFVMTFVLAGFVSAAAAKPDKNNPFRQQLSKIAKLEKKIQEAEEKEASDKKLKKLKKDLEDAQEKLAKRKDTLIAKTEAAIAKLEKALEKLREKEGSEDKVAKLEKELEELRTFLRNIPIWAQGETPDDEGLGAE